ncbi:DUF4148 domain-containing protein [Paraburkholderia sp. ZP32-5]|uniref:DUF4148 domain-containing protein n=1 Tax=Paraburkholderia sp. ZP32-5 TaxID=2883245 RepID=UPI001F26AC87|nr:DUF4148 domain-containing protein [Paraburkholderia sp. ZP32-5]
MKMFSRLGLGALLAAVGISTAFAQTISPYAPKTRAQVRADLIEWLDAGYDPQDTIDYPINAQIAGRIVAERRALRQQGQTAVQ